MGRPRKDAIYPQIPASENGHGVIYTTLSGKKYYISQNLDKKKLTLWRSVEGGYQRVASADSPYDLYKLIEE
ncbi:MAG: hypothetical protein ACI4DK_11155 [Lachnospiraceae bacterium]